MEKITVTNSTTVTASEDKTLPEKLVNYFLRTAAEGNLSPEEFNTKLVELVHAHAKNDNRRRVPATELVLNHAVVSTKLVERINEAHEVIFNTLRKMTHGVPEQLRWAQSRTVSVHVLGVYRQSSFFGKTKSEDYTSNIASGKETIRGYDTVTFEVTNYLNTKTIAEIPISLLNGDPIAVAQWVRSQCKVYAQAQQTEADKTVRDSKVQIESKMKELQKQLDEIAAAEAEAAQKLERKRLGAAAYQAKLSA